MPRSFSARDLIQLPTMNAHTLEAFGRRLLAQFQKHRKLLKKSRVFSRASALKEAVDALTAALAAQQSTNESDRRAAELDPSVDATWAALVTWLEGWARLSWTKEGQTAATILDAVFKERLKFTQEKYPQQWSEANSRIAQLYGSDKKNSYAAKIESLGGATFLEELLAKHKLFADALGLTRGTDAPASVNVRDPYEAVLSAAKNYVAAVMLLDDDDIANAEHVRTELLHVIDEFENASPRRTTDTTSEQPAPKQS